MFSNVELANNSEYWMDGVQNELYFQLKNYMESNKLNQKELAKKLNFSEGYISQVLNGNFNFSLKKLIELSIAIGKVPTIDFVDIKKKIQDLDSLNQTKVCLLYTSPSPRDLSTSRMPSSA